MISLPADFRLYVNVARNRKTRRLMREMGDRAFYCIVSLWCYTAENCPDGNLGDMDATDVADASDWQGDAPGWLNYLIDNRWLDRAIDGLRVHDWEQMQPWAARDRTKQSEANRANALKRWGKVKSDANRISSHMQSQCEGEMQLQCPQPNPYPSHPIQNTPSISPVPGDGEVEKVEEVEKKNPAPKPKKNPAPKPEPVTLNRETLDLDNLTATRIEAWTRDYPGVDIDEELAGINRWCKTATAKALKIKRWSQFIDNWLQKALADRAAGKRPTKRHTINRPLFSDGDEFERQAQARAQREQLERDRLNAEWLQRTGNA